MHKSKQSHLHNHLPNLRKQLDPTCVCSAAEPHSSVCRSACARSTGVRGESEVLTRYVPLLAGRDASTLWEAVNSLTDKEAKRSTLDKVTSNFTLFLRDQLLIHTILQVHGNSSVWRWNIECLQLMRDCSYIACTSCCIWQKSCFIYVFLTNQRINVHTNLILWLHLC